MTEGIPEPPRADIGARAARDVVVQIAGRFANLALGVFVTVLVVRSLGDAGYGEWSSLLAVVTLAGALCDLGFSQVAVRRAAAEPASEAEWVGALLLLRFLLSLLALAACAMVTTVIATDADMRTAGLVLSLTMLFGAPNALKAIFQLRVRNDALIVAMTIHSVLWALGVVLVFVFDWDLVALAVAFTLSLALATFVQALLALRLGTVRLRRARDRWPEMIRVGVPIALGSLLILAYGRIDQVLVLVLRGAEEAGLYGSAYRIFDQAQFVAISVTTTAFPLLAAAFGTDRLRFRAVLEAAVSSLVAFTIGGLVFVLVYGQEFVVLLFGSEFADATPALQILLAALVPVSLGYVLGMLVVITERQRAFVVIALVGLVANVGLNLALIPVWGFLAAAWVTLLTEVLVLSLAWAAVRRHVAGQVETRRIPLITLAGLATLAALGGLRAAGLPIEGALGAAALLYPLSILVFRAVTITDLLGLAGAAMKPRRPPSRP